MFIKIRLLVLCSALMLLLGGCYAIQGDGYTYYTPLKTHAEAARNKINRAKKRKKRKEAKKQLAQLKKAVLKRRASSRKTVVTVTVDERTQRQNRINELTEHVAGLRNKSRKLMEATLQEMLSLNAQAQEATKELVMLYQAEAEAAIGLVKRFKEKAAQLPPGDARAFLKEQEQRRRDEAKGLLMLADTEQFELKRLKREHEHLEP